ncbi:DUF3263 domain-containing protein [Luteococcus peritonei]|uniref:DUF3263 domain-containing protein n=1 Tax=Luteococcus peritonei TaxID=88874 RepID=A0ABW4RR31_9ACTN
MSEALGQSSDHPELGETEPAMLAFEASWRPGRGSREQEIRERFGISSPRYHQLLNALVDSPEALAADPLLVRRLRRLRENRQQARSAARLVR